MLKQVGATLTLLVAALPAWAHHGKDFLLTESAEQPHPGTAFLVTPLAYLNNDSGEPSELRFEPSFLYGIGDRVALEVHAHIDQVSGENWQYESTAPAIHIGLAESGNWALAFSGEYEYARDRAEPDRMEARLVLGRQTEAAGFAVNAIAARGTDGDEGTVYGYALGFRTQPEAAFSWGLEARGGDAVETGNELLIGVYGEPSEGFTYKFGIGTGYGDNPMRYSIRTGLVWQF